ncbi:YbdD/YjiX family protein [Thermocrispum municipale]|jgi:uncharacterized short protein YbdD (DUF466 family)|uniref:YbdD/YjiX family protein n=1 Tax=Thermocrispum municipale TaxID=37926 RepID=UPI000400BF6A|nr:YbdD/YjiX family protein [Thermocrispum municipale]
MTVLQRVRRTMRGVRWYLAELTGETEYDRYVEHHKRLHPGEPVLSRREYERQRFERSAQPGARCC